MRSGCRISSKTDLWEHGPLARVITQSPLSCLFAARALAHTGATQSLLDASEALALSVFDLFA
jgi:hypothetical protein